MFDPKVKHQSQTTQTNQWKLDLIKKSDRSEKYWDYKNLSCLINKKSNKELKTNDHKEVTT